MADRTGRKPGERSAIQSPAGRGAFETTKGHVFAEAWRNENFGRAIFEATRRFEIDVLKYLAEAGYPSIQPGHLKLFRYLDLEGTRLVDLASRACITKQAMQDIVDKLEKLGVVERRPDREDRRAKSVSFTSYGLEIFDVIRRAVMDGDRQMEKVVGSDLNRITDALQRYAHRWVRV